MFGFASAFVVDVLLYAVLLGAVGSIFGMDSNIVNVSSFVVVCMICSVAGLAVLRKFACPWSWGLLAAYGAIGFSLLFVFTFLGATIGGLADTFQLGVILGVTLLQGGAFVLPAILWGKRILTSPEPSPNSPR